MIPRRSARRPGPPGCCNVRAPGLLSLGPSEEDGKAGHRSDPQVSEMGTTCLRSRLPARGTRLVPATMLNARLHAKAPRKGTTQAPQRALKLDLRRKASGGERVGGGAVRAGARRAGSAARSGGRRRWIRREPVRSGPLAVAGRSSALASRGRSGRASRGRSFRMPGAVRTRQRRADIWPSGRSCTRVPSRSARPGRSRCLCARRVRSRNRA